MTTTVDYALMAGHAYRSTRNLINWFPAPQGWTPFFPVPDLSTATAFPVSMGFEAVAFMKGNEVVISYAGTATLIDWDANLALGNGVLQAQLVQAAEYYLAIKAAVPNATITLTGHSLGGGLAALIGVMFGEQAKTFDQAPFASAALSVARDLKEALLAKGFTPDQLAVLSGYIELRDSLGAFSSVVPNAHLVTNSRVNGEALGATYLVKNPIGTLVEDISNTSPGVSGIELHSQALLAAFLQSKETAETGKALNEVTAKLPALLKMIFDSKLFAFSIDSTNTKDVNFLEQIVRHESGVRDPVSGASVITADAMVTRFTKDLWKLAQDGGLTLTDRIAGNPATNFLSRTLTAFAMQFYYENSANATNQTKYLFSDVPGGVQFDMADVSKDFTTATTNSTKPDLAKIKGLDYAFKAYLAGSTFTSAERTLIQSMLPYLRDWYVQAGTSGLAITDVLDRGAFMLGGTGSDALVGGSKADVLVGNKGNDVLQGRGGNDTLIGGMDNDTYIYQTGDGLDTILDRDGSGSILYNSQTLAGGAQYGDNRVSRDAQGRVYTNVGGGRLVIDGNIIIEGWSAGKLGLNMTGPGSTSNPTTTRTITGDLGFLDVDLAAVGLQTGLDEIGNIRLDVNTPESGKADSFVDSAANDRFITGAGNDIVNANVSGDDVFEMGSGRDEVRAGQSNDVLKGGLDGDILSGGEGADRIYANNQITVDAAITQGSTDSASTLKGDFLAGNAFTGADGSLIKSMLPYLSDWYVQAGAGGLAITDVLDRHAFMQVSKDRNVTFGNPVTANLGASYVFPAGLGCSFHSRNRRDQQSAPGLKGAAA